MISTASEKLFVEKNNGGKEKQKQEITELK
jgi:hypothetical protein